MADELRADYDRLDQVANRFANQSQAIQQMLQGVRGSMDPLEQGGWVGRGSDSFFSEMNGVVLPGTERLQQALEEAEKLADLTIKIETLAGADGKLFGSVTNIQIANKLSEAGFDIDRKTITVEDIRNTGEYTATIHFHKEVKAQIEIEVIKEED